MSLHRDRIALLSIVGFLLTSGLLSATASSMELQQVYDGRLLSDSARLSAADTERITKAILHVIPPAEWAENGISCDPEQEAIRIIDRAEGGFTGAGLKQQAILFNFCSRGHNFGENGIAVFERDRVEALVVYAGAWENSIEVLPDINGNGRAEMVVSAGGTNMGEHWGVIGIIELDTDGVTAFGRSETYHNDCDTEYASGTEAVVLSAKPGKEAVFYRQTFHQSCAEGAPWRQSEARRQVDLEEDGSAYRRIK